MAKRWRTQAVLAVEVAIEVEARVMVLVEVVEVWFVLFLGARVMAREVMVRNVLLT